MLTKFHKSEKGFTLIELLIVVAIIGILAAIAIPQFAAYRMRAFNGAAQADVKNARTAQEALFADFQTYGKTDPSVALPGAGGGGNGLLTVGPMTASTAAVVGSCLTGGRNVDGLAVGVGSGVSNGVSFVSDVPAAPAAAPFGNVTFTMYTKHTQGSRVFATETEGTAIWFVEDEANWVGVALAAGGAPATVPAVTTGPDIDGATPGGGSPIANWTAL